MSEWKPVPFQVGDKISGSASHWNDDITLVPNADEQGQVTLVVRADKRNGPYYEGTVVEIRRANYARLDNVR
jgi:hypothetical protein